jgi:hypothetical protein
MAPTPGFTSGKGEMSLESTLAKAFGLTVQTTGKLWFLDRMALLYGEVSSAAEAIPPRTDR